MRAAPVSGWLSLLVAAAFAVPAGGPASAQQKSSLEDLVSSVVRIKTFIAPDGRTVENLGREREGRPAPCRHGPESAHMRALLVRERIRR